MPVEAAPVKVACIGDSITFGLGLDDPARESYPAVLQTLLGPGYDVRNFGNSGRTVYLHTYRPPPNEHEIQGYYYQPEHRAALAFVPDIVICNLGINDGEEYPRREREQPGSFVADYTKLLSEYEALPTRPRFYIWTKLTPLAPGQKCYEMPGQFLVQKGLEEVAARFNARTINMTEPLRGVFEQVLPDALHPNAAGARIIAEATFKVLKAPERPRPELPADVAANAEVWLLAGQSNMQWPLGRCTGAEDEAKALAGHDVRLWDFESDRWVRLTPENAAEWSCVAVAFARRRAEATKKPVLVLLVAVGGAPTEAFLSEPTMAAVDADLKQVYPNLFRIVRNRHQIDTNPEFPSTWCAQEYQPRLAAEARWWGLSALYDAGFARVKHIKLTGVVWYQGESNATTGVGPRGGEPLPADYMAETLRAAAAELRTLAGPAPIIMVGLPKMDRDWAPFRALQAQVSAEAGLRFVDTFAAGLGEMENVHPADKVPLAALVAAEAAAALE